MERRLGCYAVAVLSVMFLAGPAAMGKDWAGPSGLEASWFFGSNWTPPGVPGTSDYAYISNGGTAVVGTGPASAYELRVGNAVGAGGGLSLVGTTGGQLSIGSGLAYIGYSGTGTVTHQGGPLNVSGGGSGGYGNLYLGYNGTGAGTYYFNKGAINVDTLYVGYQGQGDFYHNGGTNICRTELIMAYCPSSRGHYVLDQVDYAVTSNLIGGFAVKCAYVGYEGEAFFEAYRGTFTCRGDLVLGKQPLGTGVYEIRGGTLDVIGGLYEGTYYGKLKVGEGGTGTFRIIGDDATITVDGYTQNNRSRLEAFINDGGVSAIEVDGDAWFAPGSTLFVGFKPGTAPHPGTWQILDVVGAGHTLSGSLAFADGVDTDPSDGKYWTMGFDTGSGAVMVNYIPEPATLGLLAAGVAGLIARRRRP